MCLSINLLGESRAEWMPNIELEQYNLSDEVIIEAIRLKHIQYQPSLSLFILTN